jgi:pimeloyl-ACP methyl ester carboxylesterase
MRTGVIEARGLVFPTLEAGDGPLVLCLHGFPDHRRSFRHQLPMLAAAGFRAVAPAMRGYAPEAVPADGCYQTAALATDVVAMIEALGYDDAVVFGHDWGAVAAYGAAVAAPKRVRRLVTSAVPPPMQMAMALASNYTQMKRSWYMFFFQLPLADVAIAQDDFAFIEHLWADWSPGWRCPAAEMAAVKEAFRHPPTLAAALGYYRAMLDPSRWDPALADLQTRFGMAPIEVPTLYIHGADDGCIGREVAEGITAAMFPAGVRAEVVAAAGHFVHQEQPERVNALLREFLR